MEPKNKQRRERNKKKQREEPLYRNTTERVLGPKEKQRRERTKGQERLTKKITTEYLLPSDFYYIKYYKYSQFRYFPIEHLVESSRVELNTAIYITNKQFDIYEDAFFRKNGKKLLWLLKEIISSCDIGRRLEYAVSRNENPAYYTYEGKPKLDELNTTSDKCNRVGLNYSKLKRYDNSRQINIMLQYGDEEKVFYRETGKKDQPHFRYSYEINIHLTGKDAEGIYSIRDNDAIIKEIRSKKDKCLEKIREMDYHNKSGVWRNHLPLNGIRRCSVYTDS